MMSWERVQLPAGQWQDGAQRKFGETSGPGKRWGHTCNAIKGRYLYVFGGYGNANCQTNEVHVFDTARLLWIEHGIKGIPPAPRDSHTCTTVGDYLFIFGGTDGMHPLKDLHVLDTSANIWLHPRPRGEEPAAREGHGAALVGKRLFVFGGSSKSSNCAEVFYNDLYILDTDMFVWERAVTSGNSPPPRGSHTCSSWKNKFIVIGGEDANDHYLSDVHILDTDTLNWVEISTTGNIMSPRAGHTAFSFEKYVFVFGGYSDAQNLYDDLHLLDLDTCNWIHVVTSGDGPSPRFSAAGACLNPQNYCVLAFMGGCNKSLEALGDMYFLNTGLAGVEKLSMRKQLKLKCQEENRKINLGKAPMEYGVRPDACQTRQGQGYGQGYGHGYGYQSGRPFVPNQSNDPNAKKKFQANLSRNNTSGGYSMETTIDGKHLLGILFPNKPMYIDFPSHSSRKRTFRETGSVFSNGEHSKSKSSPAIKLDSLIERLRLRIHGKASTSNDPQMNIARHIPPWIASQPGKVIPVIDLTIPSESDCDQPHDEIEMNTQDKIGDSQNNLQVSKGNSSEENAVVADDNAIVLIPNQGAIMDVPVSNEADSKTEAAENQQSAA